MNEVTPKVYITKTQLENIVQNINEKAKSARKEEFVSIHLRKMHLVEEGEYQPLAALNVDQPLLLDLSKPTVRKDKVIWEILDAPNFPYA